MRNTRNNIEISNLNGVRKRSRNKLGHSKKFYSIPHSGAIVQTKKGITWLQKYVMPFHFPIIQAPLNVAMQMNGVYARFSWKH